MEVIISLFSNLFGLKDPLSGFKLYRTKMITNKDFKNIGQYFLVDFYSISLKKKKIVNFNIITKKRNDESRVGDLLVLA